MNPGRELDALVAEKVMGLECGIIAGNPKVRGSNCGTIGCTLHWIDTLPYSTSIEAAWEVVEKLKKEGKALCLGWWEWPEKQEWYVSNSTDEGLLLDGWDSGESDEFTVHADTAPHAICLAALKAVGVEVKP